MEQIAFQRSGGDNYVTGVFAISNELYSACLQAEHRGHNPLAFIARDEDVWGEKYLGYLYCV